MINFKRVSPKARVNMIIAGLIGLIITSIIVMVVRMVLLQWIWDDGVILVVNIIALGIIGILILNVILQPTVGYMRHQYSIGDKSIEKITGIFSIRHEIVPIRRMQQIETVEGVVNRILGLASIQIITAGGILKLEYIQKDEANRIADELKGLINEFAEAAGDENGK